MYRRVTTRQATHNTNPASAQECSIQCIFTSGHAQRFALSLSFQHSSLLLILITTSALTLSFLSFYSPELSVVRSRLTLPFSYLPAGRCADFDFGMGNGIFSGEANAARDAGQKVREGLEAFGVKLVESTNVLSNAVTNFNTAMSSNTQHLATTTNTVASRTDDTINSTSHRLVVASRDILRTATSISKECRQTVAALGDDLKSCTDTTATSFSHSADTIAQSFRDGVELLAHAIQDSTEQAAITANRILRTAKAVVAMALLAMSSMFLLYVLATLPLPSTWNEYRFALCLVGAIVLFACCWWISHNNSNVTVLMRPANRGAALKQGRSSNAARLTEPSTQNRTVGRSTPSPRGHFAVNTTKQDEQKYPYEVESAQTARPQPQSAPAPTVASAACRPLDLSRIIAWVPPPFVSLHQPLQPVPVHTDNNSLRTPKPYPIISCSRVYKNGCGLGLPLDILKFAQS